MTADISDDQWREIVKQRDSNLNKEELDAIVAGKPLKLSEDQLRQVAEDYNVTVEEARKLAAETPSKYSHDELREYAASNNPMRSDDELRQLAVERTLPVTTAELVEPDFEDPSRGFNYSEENNVATVIDRCAASVNVYEADFEITFTSDDGSLGEVPIGVMRDGTLFASEGEVNGWHMDANGDWTKK